MTEDDCLSRAAVLLVNLRSILRYYSTHKTLSFFVVLVTSSLRNLARTATVAAGIAATLTAFERIDSKQLQRLWAAGCLERSDSRTG